VLTTVSVVLLVAVRPPASVTVTVKMYVPAAVNVAVVFLAELSLLSENVTGLAPVHDQLYVRFDSPPSSAPSTDSEAVVPADGLGEAEAAAAIVGAWFGFTVSVKGVDCAGIEPYVPLIVIEVDPTAVPMAALNVTVVALVAGFGLNDAVTPVGKLHAAIVTPPENPPDAVIVTVDDALPD
jgi:hypothetical protein